MRLSSLLIPPALGAKQTLRLRRVGLAALSYALTTPLVAIACAFGVLPVWAIVEVAAAYIAINLGLYAAIRSGFNLRFKDPSLTLLQILVAITLLMYIVYNMDDARDVALFSCFIIFAFGIFRLGAREFTLVTLYALAGYGLVIYLMMHWRPEAIHDVRREWMSWLMLAGFLPSFAIIGEHFNKLRRRLRESETRWRSVVDAAFDGVMTHDQGRILEANERFARIFGYGSPDELIGRQVLEALCLPGCSEEVCKMLTEPGLREPREMTGRRKDGTTFLGETQAADSMYQGKSVRTVTMRDITERKQAEAELRKLSRAVEQSPASIVITDQTGRIEYVNPHFEQVTGYTRAEAVGSNPRILKSGTTPAETYKALWKAVSEGGEWRGELCNRRKNGELFWEYAAISGLKDESGRVSHYIAVKEDITVHKRAESALAQLAAIVDSSQDAIVGRGLDLKVFSWNAAAEQLFGYAAQEVIGKDIAFLIPADRQSEVVRKRESLAGGRTAPTYDTVRLARGGRRVDVSITQSPIRNAGGEITGVSLTIRDITERKRLEEMHLRAQRLESLGTLSAGIAHDFNNILAAIRGNADLAAKDVGPDHVAAESLEEVRKASSRATELVRRIMAFGRAKEARQAVVDLGAVVSEVLVLLRSTVTAGISLDRDFAADTPHVLADAGQIHEAIVNLTTNASHAIGPRAGSIEYRLEPVQVDEKMARGIPGLKPGRYARLSVRDSGRGMDAGTMERIFDAFYTTKPVGEGTGLGLSMVHGIMKSHGGAVTVESVPGKGASFALYFPAAREQLQKDQGSVPAQRLQCAPQRVLYVDDEEPLVFLARRVLSRLGHKVSGFSEPREALEAFRAAPQDYDVLVTDLSMPLMSGFELARAVLALRPGMPVLMTSGHLVEEDEHRAREAGIRRLILKPVTMEELSQELDRMLHGDGPQGLAASPGRNLSAA